MRNGWGAFFIVLACWLGPGRGAMAATEAELAGCAAIETDAERLQCYDRLAGRGAAAPQPAAPAEPASALTERWELDAAAKRGIFSFTAYQQNYFIPYHYTHRPNNSPSRVGEAPAAREDRLNNEEATFQLSFKVKIAENLFPSGSDLWFGYSQYSVWQMYNKALSSPFRNTDYQPELMYVIPTGGEVLGLKWRMLNIGLVHQSNGRGEPLSRSWNRAYAQFGFERGDFVLLVKPWYRFDEDTPDDDNPEITDYLGRGEVLAIYRSGRQQFSARWRNSFQAHDNRGSILLDWSFPLVGNLKGYAQFFNGYGETLLDYNRSQTSFGLGILLTD
jgi:phospholipase A1